MDLSILKGPTTISHLENTPRLEYKDANLAAIVRESMLDRIHMAWVNITTDREKKRHLKTDETSSS